MFVFESRRKIFVIVHTQLAACLEKKSAGGLVNKLITIADGCLFHPQLAFIEQIRKSKIVENKINSSMEKKIFWPIF